MTTKVPDFVDNRAQFRNKQPVRTAPVNAPKPAPEPREPKVKKLDDESIMDHLQEIPQVQGYRIMLIPVQPRTKNGIIELPDEVINKQLNHAQIFRVVGMGPDAYKDEERFPHGAFCQVGDYVYIGRYAGSIITSAYCQELRIINDDEVMAVIPDVEDTLTIV